MNSIQDKLMQQFQSMDSAYEEYAKAHGLNYLSLMVLEEIYELGNGCTQKRISDDTHYPKQSINLVIKAFLADGIVALKELPENRKNKGISLTTKGQQLCEKVVVPLLRQEETAVEKIGTAERQQLIRLLELYSEAYCEQLSEIM